MLFLKPNALISDLGFQLSFLATIGLVYFSPIWQKILKDNGYSFLNWKSNLSTTLAAICFVMPWLFYKQGMISLISPVINFIVVPLVPFLMFFGFLSGILFWPLNWIPGFIAYIFSYLIMYLISWSADFSLSQIQINLEGFLSFIIVLLVYAYIVFLIYKNKK